MPLILKEINIIKIIVITFVLLIITFVLSGLSAAPVPIKEKQAQKIPTNLNEVNWIGDWNMYWDDFLWDTKLHKNNDYTAEWEGLTYYGSWWISNNQLCIYESITPNELDSYNTYRITLDPVTLKGIIVLLNERELAIGWQTPMKFTKK